MVEGPGVPPIRVCLERNAQCFKGSLQLIEMAAATAEICVSPPIRERKCAFACRGGSGNTSPIKRSRRTRILVTAFSVLIT